MNQLNPNTYEVEVKKETSNFQFIYDGNFNL